MAVHWGDFGPAGSAKVNMLKAEEIDVVRPKALGDELYKEKMPKETKEDKVVQHPTAADAAKGENKWEELLVHQNPKLAEAGHIRPHITPDQVVKVLKSAAGITEHPDEDKK